MSNFFGDVVQFNEAARGDLPQKPTMLTLDQTKLCLRLIIEESFETVEACFREDSEVLGRLTMHKNEMQKILKHQTESHDLQQDNVELLDGLCDTVYVAMGMAAMAGLPFNEGMAEVCHANLAKIDKETGRCTKDEGGKILKPFGWIKQDLKAVIEWCHRFGNRGHVRYYSQPVAIHAEMADRLDNCGEFPGNLEGLSKPDALAPMAKLPDSSL